MVFLPLRAVAVFTAVVSLSACSSLGDLRLPAWAGGKDPAASQAVAAQARPAAAPAALQPTDRTETWQGIYSYQADAGRFVECRTGANMPVAQEGDNALLESAYLAAQPAPGAPMRVEVQGRWVQRPMVDAPPPAQQLVLLVERFVSVTSSASCTQRW